MSLEEILQYNPDLCKLSFIIMSEILRDKFNLQFDQNKTWNEMGLDDDLDQIEYIMELEKELSIQIPDDIIYDIFGLNNKPIDFASYIRDKKITDLGI